MKKIALYVQHFLGTGHLFRAHLLAEELGKSDFDVFLISGGTEVVFVNSAYYKLIQLPPIKAKDSSYKTYLTDKGAVVDDAYRKTREDYLNSTILDINPDVFITELFPFGRHSLKNELIPLLEKLKKNKVKIFSSIRDILQPKEDHKKNKFIQETVNDFYDALLIHGDKEFIPLEESCSFVSCLKPELYYTGYICDPAIKGKQQNQKAPQITVSVGGGRVGHELIDLCATLSQKEKMSHINWVLFSKTIAKTKKKGNLRIVPYSRYYIDELSRSNFVISKAGYNTIVEILKVEIPSLLIPFSENNEIEQVLRANMMKKYGYSNLLSENALSLEELEKSVLSFLNLNIAKQRRPSLNGIEMTKQFIKIF